MSIRLVRKSLYRKIVEAAEAQGLAFKTEVVSGNLEYFLNGTQVTPGEAADRLGVEIG